MSLPEHQYHGKIREVDNDRDCSTCHKSIDSGYFVERGKDAMCPDCLLVAINDGTFALVDPKRKLGLHCHKCNVMFTMTDGMVQRGTTGALYCFKCAFKRPKRKRRAK